MVAVASLALGCRGAGGGHSAKDEAHGRADAVEGRALYDRYGCATCHGSDGGGDGPMAERLRVRPRDFRKTETYRYGAGASEVAETIEKGGMPGGGMPAFPDLPAAQRSALAAFIVSLQIAGDRPPNTRGGT